MDTALTPFGEKIEQTKQLLNAVRGSSIKIGQNLYEIKASLEPGTNWGELIRDHFDISESFASKLMSIYKGFVIDGGISQDRLESIDGERLYLALKLSGSANEKLAKASTLTRLELKQERNDEKPHEHEWIEICKKCSVRNYEENHTHEG